MPKLESPGDRTDLPAARRRWALVALLAVWLAVTILLGAKLAGETVDDFFITYRYSQNLLAGEGFVFNPGERVFGTTAPGWGLLVASMSALTGLAPAVAGTWTSALALLFTAGWLAWRGFLRGRLAEPALAGSLLLTSSFLWVHNGSEAFTANALLVLAASLAGRRPAASGGMAGLAVWLRPETALAGVLLALLAWRQARRVPLGFGLVFSAAVGLGLVWATLYFGTPLPNTLHAKQLQAAWNPEVWASGVGFWREAWRWLSIAYSGPWIGVLVGGGGAGLISLLRTRERPLQLLAAYGVALFLAYPILGVPFYTWYAIPFLVALLYGLAYLTGDLCRGVRRRVPSLPGALALALVLSVPVTLLSAHVGRRMVAGFLAFEAIPQTELYRSAGEWLRKNSPPDADVAHVEVGALAYYSDRPVRDLLGLVSPENLPYVERRDLAAALEVHPARFFVHHTRLAGFLDPILREDWFASRYEPVERFEARLSGDVLTLYRLRSR